MHYIKFFFRGILWLLISSLARADVVYMNQSILDPSIWQSKIHEAMKNIVDKPSCEKAGGKWVQMGMAAGLSCRLPTPDAGKQCTDDAQCAMICQPTGQNSKSGICSSSFSLLGGCWTGMSFGKPRTGGPLCVD